MTRPDDLAFRFWQGGYTLWGALAGLCWRPSSQRRQAVSNPLPYWTQPRRGPFDVALGRFCEGWLARALGRKRWHSWFSAVPSTMGRMALRRLHAGGAAALVFLGIVLSRRICKQAAGLHCRLSWCAPSRLCLKACERTSFALGLCARGAIDGDTGAVYLLNNALFIKRKPPGRHRGISR